MTTLTCTWRSPVRPRPLGGRPRERQRDASPRLRAGRDLDREVALEARHLDRRAERGQRRGDVDHRVQVLAVADEALVLAHADERRRGRRSGRRARRRGRARSAGSAGRRRSRPGRRPRACAARAPCRRRRQTEQGCSGIAAVAAAAVAHRGAHELAERGPRDGLELAGAVAARAGDDRRPRLGAVAVAVLAAHLGLVGDLDPLAARRLREVDADRDDDVAALDRPAAARRRGRCRTPSRSRPSRRTR